MPFSVTGLLVLSWEAARGLPCVVNVPPVGAVTLILQGWSVIVRIPSLTGLAECRMAPDTVESLFLTKMRGLLIVLSVQKCFVLFNFSSAKGDTLRCHTLGSS